MFAFVMSVIIAGLLMQFLMSVTLFFIIIRLFCAIFVVVVLRLWCFRGLDRIIYKFCFSVAAAVALFFFFFVYLIFQVDFIFNPFLGLFMLSFQIYFCSCGCSPQRYELRYLCLSGLFNNLSSMCIHLNE